LPRPALLGVLGIYPAGGPGAMVREPAFPSSP
jgi:hypothetical protein